MEAFYKAGTIIGIRSSHHFNPKSKNFQGVDPRHHIKLAFDYRLGS